MLINSALPWPGAGLLMHLQHERNAPINHAHICSGAERGLYQQPHLPYKSEQTQQLSITTASPCLPATLCPKFFEMQFPKLFMEQDTAMLSAHGSADLQETASGTIR